MKKLILSICLLAVIVGCKKKDCTLNFSISSSQPRLKGNTINISYNIDGVKLDTVILGNCGVAKLFPLKKGSSYAVTVYSNNQEQYRIELYYTLADGTVKSNNYESANGSKYTLAGSIN